VELNAPRPCAVAPVQAHAHVIVLRGSCGFVLGYVSTLRRNVGEGFAAKITGNGLFKEYFELFISELYCLGHKAFQQPTTLAEPVRSIFPLLLFMLLKKLFPLVFKLLDLILEI
jgi:hypothetical protein